MEDCNQEDSNVDDLDNFMQFVLAELVMVMPKFNHKPAYLENSKAQSTQFHFNSSSFGIANSTPTNQPIFKLICERKTASDFRKSEGTMLSKVMLKCLPACKCQKLHGDSFSLVKVKDMAPCVFLIEKHLLIHFRMGALVSTFREWMP